VKAKAHFLPWVLGVAALSDGLYAQESDPVYEVHRGTEGENRQDSAEQNLERAARSRMQQQLNDMIRQEAAFTGADRTRRDEGEPMPRGNDGGTLELEPMVVEGKRVKAIPPPVRETKVQELLRTGVVWENAGARFTQRFWMKGDRGIMFTVSW
jgi:hypothetical protein